jgi:isoleucyl-tRNA synthetase
LKERAVEGWDDFEGHTPHRPWIDKVKIRNPKTRNLMSRIADVGNPWLDAGIVPYSTMGYNHDRKYWEQWFPADFITESFPGQFRNWFYAILAMSTMMENRPPFKVLLGHALVRDETGETMSKSKGNAIEFNEAADRMGADLMRWLYCRSNPAANINFGYGPADELRAKFTLKLWNTYAFLCNYARLDNFDPAAPQLPVKDRPDLDRWILSDLQKLIALARESFETYNLMAFCQEVEKFVDDKLSNWWVRRSRKRMWKSEKGLEKQAAYQTLYTVLMTLTKLVAPVMPFLAERMYQNIIRGEPWKTSVHWCEYPAVDATLIDEQLSADMDALLRLVSLGSAARNSAKIKVRQPLAEMRVQPGVESEHRALERFDDQIRDELNIKRITKYEGDLLTNPMLPRETKANLKVLGPKYGPKLAEIQTALAKANRNELAEKILANGGAALPLPSERTFILTAEDVQIGRRVPENWAAAGDLGLQVMIDTRITPELKREGMARDVIRQVQNLRKDANLEMEDRITLYLQTESAELRQAIETHRTYIASETLTVQWTSAPLDGAATANAKVESQALTIQLRKAT